MNALGPTRRSFLQKLVAAGSVAIAAPALVLEELRERELQAAFMRIIDMQRELAVKAATQAWMDWIMYGDGPIAERMNEDKPFRGLTDEPLRPGFMELIAARVNRT
jgi:hypothetical protein